jgi:hypothetical protein
MKRSVRTGLVVAGLAAAFLGGSLTTGSVGAQQWGQGGGWQGQRRQPTPKQITQMSIVGLRRIATRLKDCGTDCAGETEALQAVNAAIVALGGHALP